MEVAPLLGGLFLILAVGVVLRARLGMGTREADTLNTVIMDVTMPALIVSSLHDRELDWHVGMPLVASVLALLLASALGFLVVRLARGDGKAAGAGFLTASFSNTGFLGFPLLLLLYPKNGAAASTAIVVDTVDTTLLLWTYGLAVAQRLGHGGGVDAKATLKLLLRPLTFALVIGVALHGFHVTLPAFLDRALASLGACTSPLVFLALGLQLDAKSIAARPLSVVLTALVKLAVAPLIALALVRLLRVDEPAASVVVLQAAMPSAMASVMVAARAGCDRALAAGVATLSTLLCIVSLPAIGWLLDYTK